MSQWRPVNGYEDRYLVSDRGEVYGIRSDKLLSQRLNHKGYKRVRFNVDGAVIVKRVNRLVAQAFLPNPDNLPEVNHKNRCKIDNSVSNLEWCSSQQNNEHAHSKHYVVITPTGAVLQIFNLNKFARSISAPPSKLHDVACGRRKHWKKYQIRDLAHRHT